MLHDQNYMETGKVVDDALRTAPEFSLSVSFADVVAEKVSRKIAWKQYFKEFLIYLCVFLGIGVASAAMSLIYFDANWKDWWNFIVSNAGLVAGIQILATFVLFADRVLLRYFMYRAKMEII